MLQNNPAADRVPEGFNPDSDPAPQELAPPLLVQYWQAAVRWKWVIAGIIAFALAVGLVMTLLTTPQYTAKTRIEISRDQKKVTNLEGVESSEARRDIEFYQTQYALLSARSLAERVSKSLRLAENTAFFESQGITPEGSSLFVTGNRPLTATQRAAREKMAVSLLLGGISIEPVRGSALVDIRYTSASPQVSAKVANAWAQQFIQASMDRRFASTADARSFLEGRLADLRGKLEASERNLVNYASEKGIVALDQSRDAEGKTTVGRTLASTEIGRAHV